MVEVLSQPATPSKSKLHGRRGFCSFTGLLVGFALLAGAPGARLGVIQGRRGACEARVGRRRRARLRALLPLAAANTRSRPRAPALFARTPCRQSLQPAQPQARPPACARPSAHGVQALAPPPAPRLAAAAAHATAASP